MSLREEVIRCYEALNKGDPKPFLDLYDPDIEMFVPSWSNPDSGLFRGSDAVNRWWGLNFANWTDMHWELRQVDEHGPNVVLALHWTGRGKRSGLLVDGDFLSVVTFRDGKIVSLANLGGISEAHPK